MQADHNAFRQIAREAVDDAIWLPDDADEKLERAKSNYSFLRFLLTEATNAAVADAVARGTSAEDFEYDLLPEAIQIVRDIQFAFVRAPYEGDPRKNWNFWKHDLNPIDRIQNKNLPYIDRSDLEVATTRYLNSPFRCAAIDRLLVDALVAMEIFSFGDEMLNPYVRWKSPLKQRHVLLSYISGQFGNFVFFGAIVALLMWLKSKDVLGETATVWAVVVVVGLFVLLLIISTVFLPGLWLQQRAQKGRVAKLLEGMLSVYSELRSDGAISAQHIRTRAQGVASDGVIWPAPLFVMLDDIIGRTGRF